MANLEIGKQSPSFESFLSHFFWIFGNIFYNFYQKCCDFKNIELRKILRLFVTFCLFYYVCTAFKCETNWAQFWKFPPYFAKWRTWKFLRSYLLWNLASINLFRDNCINTFLTTFLKKFLTSRTSDSEKDWAILLRSVFCTIFLWRSNVKWIEKILKNSTQLGKMANLEVFKQLLFLESAINHLFSW